MTNKERIAKTVFNECYKTDVSDITAEDIKNYRKKDVIKLKRNCIGIAAAAAVAVIGFIGINSVKGADNEIKTDKSVYENLNSNSKLSSSLNENLSSVSTDNLKLDSNTDSSQADSASDSSSSDSSNNEFISNPNSTPNHINTDSSDSKPISNNNSDSESAESKTDKDINITGDELLNMTVNQALELCGAYQTISPVGNSKSVNVYQSSKFPKYCFGSYSGDNEKIDFLNLYDGAYINDDIYVGMTYNELVSRTSWPGSGREVLWKDSNSDLVYYLYGCDKNGTLWAFGFLLTEEQKNEIDSRIKENEKKYREFQQSGEFHPDMFTLKLGVDISDINPVSYIAVYEDASIHNYEGLFPEFPEDSLSSD